MCMYTINLIIADLFNLINLACHVHVRLFCFSWNGKDELWHNGSASAIAEKKQKTK